MVAVGSGVLPGSYPRPVESHDQPRGRVYEREGTLVVGTNVSTETRVVRGVNERRLGVLGLVLGVGLSALAIGLAVDGWRGAIVAAVGASPSSSSS
jgi:hypothetical protein